MIWARCAASGLIGGGLCAEFGLSGFLIGIGVAILIGIASEKQP